MKQSDYSKGSDRHQMQVRDAACMKEYYYNIQNNYLRLKVYTLRPQNPLGYSRSSYSLCEITVGRRKGVK